MDFKNNYIINNNYVNNFINLSDEEKALVLKWRNHESVRYWMYSTHVISKKEHLEFINNLKSDNKNFYWLVSDMSGNGLGVIYLQNYDMNNRNAYFGIYTNPERRGKKIGIILIECLKTIAFKIGNLHTLKLEVLDFNERAIKFYMDVGFQREGVLAEFVYRDSKWHDVLIMGAINRDQ